MGKSCSQCNPNGTLTIIRLFRDSFLFEHTAMNAFWIPFNAFHQETGSVFVCGAGLPPAGGTPGELPRVRPCNREGGEGDTMALDLQSSSCARLPAVPGNRGRSRSPRGSAKPPRPAETPPPAKSGPLACTP